ncbi:MAG: Anti-sigma-K factor rskA, partial [Actinomycetota bacterium]|nr:Anti-sigma-K factor rskA [Actinomycetota bacterium]
VAHLTAGDTELPVVVTPDGTAWLEATALPALADGRTYQLWGMADGDAISLGVLGRDPRTVSFDAEGYAGLAITEERSPGVVRSENPPVASGSLA